MKILVRQEQWRDTIRKVSSKAFERAPVKSTLNIIEGLAYNNGKEGKIPVVYENFIFMM